MGALELGVIIFECVTGGYFIRGLYRNWQRHR